MDVYFSVGCYEQAFSQLSLAGAALVIVRTSRLKTLRLP
jgi:hypothetical protein